MEHLRSDIAELPQLGVGDALDGAGVLHDLGVGHEEAGDVSPVFVDVGVQRRRRQSAGDVAAAPGKGLDRAVRHGAVKARNHYPAAADRVTQRLIGSFLIHRAVQLEFQPQFAVQKVIAQIICHQPGGEILAPAHQLILTDALVHFPAQRLKFRLQIGFQFQLVPDVQIPPPNHVEHVVAGYAVFQMRIAQIQQIRQLVVAAEALSRRRNHYHPAAGIRLHDGLYLCKLMGVCHGGAAKFQHF